MLFPEEQSGSWRQQPQSPADGLCNFNPYYQWIMSCDFAKHLPAAQGGEALPGS